MRGLRFASYWLVEVVAFPLFGGLLVGIVGTIIGGIVSLAVGSAAPVAIGSSVGVAAGLLLGFVALVHGWREERDSILDGTFFSTGERKTARVPRDGVWPLESTRSAESGSKISDSLAGDSSSLVERDRKANLRPLLAKIIERDGSSCALTWGKGCGQPLSLHSGDTQVDHIVPLSRFYELCNENKALFEIIARPDLHGARSLGELDGANDLRNLAALCASCNASAGDRTPVELGRRRKRERRGRNGGK